MKTMLNRTTQVVALAGLLLAGCQTPTVNSLATHDSRSWEAEIKALEAADATNRPPGGSIIFVGSSSIKRWKRLAVDFPDRPVFNKGFGGSQLADSVNYADRIIIPYRPREVVIYAGGNDIHAGKSPERVFGDFVALVQQIRSALPRTKIAFISIAPNPNRWKEVEDVKATNRLIERYCHRHQLSFINVFPLMLGPNGQPKPDIYVSDGLHMNEKGYRIWRDAVRPYL
jgi:lysophospholipase L1-like esterase